MEGRTQVKAWMVASFAVGYLGRKATADVFDHRLHLNISCASLILYTLLQWTIHPDMHGFMVVVLIAIPTPLKFVDNQ